MAGLTRLQPVGAADPQCDQPWKNKEKANTGCGLGFELALVLPLLALGRRLRRRELSS